MMRTPLRIDGSQREDDDFQLYKRLVRDVCHVYHIWAGYGAIMGDLDYAGDYSLPYWDLVNRINPGASDARVVRSGILVLLMAMIWDELDGSGCWISHHSNDVIDHLKEFIPEDVDMLRLCDVVLHGLTLLDDKKAQHDRFQADSKWAYDAFVRRYFIDCAKIGHTSK